ncbi:MAG: calcium-binding protein [Myxococcota bacterium]
MSLERTLQGALLGICMVAGVNGCSAVAEPYPEQTGKVTEALALATVDTACTELPNFDRRQYCLNLGISPNNIIEGDGQSTQINGTSGADCIIGSSLHESINAGGGNDIVFGGDGNDTIDAGSGNDEVYGEAGHDNIRGGSGNDMLFGGEQVDAIFGGTGDDTLVGGNDHDTLIGEDGLDHLWGGPGNDNLTGDLENGGGTATGDAIVDCEGFNSIVAPTSADRCRLNADTASNGCNTRLCGSPIQPSQQVGNVSAQSPLTLFSMGMTEAELLVGTGAEIRRIPFDGGIQSAIALDATSPIFDVANGFIYYTASDSLRRSPVTGGATTLVHQGTTVDVPQVAGERLFALDINGISAETFASMPLSPLPSVPQTLFSADITTSVRRNYIISCGQIFYPNSDTGDIRRREGTGSGSTTLVAAPGVEGTVTAAAASTSHLYLVTAERLYAISKADGSVQVLATPASGRTFSKLVVDDLDNRLYFTSHAVVTGGGCSNGRLESISLNGSARTTIEDYPPTPANLCIRDLIQDDRRLFAIRNDGSVRRWFK